MKILPDKKGIENPFEAINLTKINHIFK